MSSVQDAAPDSSSLIFDPRLVKVRVLSMYSALICIIIIIPNVEFRTGMEVDCLVLVPSYWPLLFCKLLVEKKVIRLVSKGWPLLAVTLL
jgi:hypothetical protein